MGYIYEDYSMLISIEYGVCVYIYTQMWNILGFFKRPYSIDSKMVVQ